MRTGNRSTIGRWMRASGESDIDPSGSGRNEHTPARIRLLILVTVGLFVAGTFLPIHTAFGSPAHSMYADNRTTNVMVLLLTILPLCGLMFANRRWWAFGWAIGSLAITSSWALGAVAVTVMEVRVPATFGDPLLMDGHGGGVRDPALAGDPGYFIGFFAMALAVIVGSVTVALGFVAERGRHRRTRVDGWQWLLGAVASALLSVGFMLPVSGDDIGFIDRNFQTGNAFISIASLALASSFGVVGVIGFSMRSWTSLSAVAATTIPAAWLYAVYAFGLDTPDEPGPTLLKSYAVHGVVAVALCAQAVAIAIAVIRRSTVAPAAHPVNDAAFAEPIIERLDG